jgi:TIGR03009 family protein
MLKPVLAGLAISSLCLALTTDLMAQSGTKNQSGSQKKTPIQPVQAVEDEPASPPVRPRTRSQANGSADAAGESARPEGKGGKAPRPPASEPLRIVKLSPKLEKILKDWEFHTSQFKTMTCEFTRFKYDKTFEVEKRAEGKVAYAAPDKGNYEILVAKIDQGEKSKKKNRDGIPYALKSDEPERWVCTGKEVIRMDEKAKPPTCERVSIPPESQGQNIIDGPLPFLFGMKAERAKSRYRDIELLESEEGEIKLQVRSKEKQDTTAWDTAVIIIDAEKFTPKAVKLKDVTGAESVHVFRNVVVNAKKGFFDKDPFNPNLRGYKQILPPTDSPRGKAVSDKGPASPRDNADLDLGRTADSAADIPARKKATTVNRK